MLNKENVSIRHVKCIVPCGTKCLDHTNEILNLIFSGKRKTIKMLTLNSSSNASLKSVGNLYTDSGLQYMWMCVSVLTVVLNAAVLALLLKKSSHDVKAWYEQLMYQVVSDVLVGLFQFFYFIVNIFDIGTLVCVCRTSITLYICSQINSTINVLFLSIRRLSSVRNIHRIGQVWSRYRTYMQGVINLFCAICVTVYSVMLFDNSPTEGLICDLDLTYGQNSHKALILALLIILVCVLGTNLTCFMCIWILRRSSKVLPDVLECSCRSQHGTVHACGFCNIVVKRKAAEKKAVFTLVLVLCALDLCTTPTVISAFLMAMDVNVSLVLRRAFLNVNALNSLLNPLIYFLRIRTLRKSFLQR